MNKRIIAAPDAPAATGGYSQAIEVAHASRTLYVSGRSLRPRRAPFPRHS
jgi:enamine deaminase RidA (YjgF/YER057c/UK114 family)